ncbi:MAG: hypothetical protein HY080_00515 [Gammaproteobacteria bacterium]|nr:hypothetical protein [Gammaproteobacteria bacterium]
MSDVSINGTISNVQRGVYKAMDSAPTATKEAAEAAQKNLSTASSSDNLGKHLDVLA